MAVSVVFIPSGGTDMAGTVFMNVGFILRTFGQTLTINTFLTSKDLFQTFLGFVNAGIFIKNKFK